ncbi:hypothetical protein K8R32_03785, partial [bacterium]|nr:hypothetical protein [bacterium]
DKEEKLEEKNGLVIFKDLEKKIIKKNHLPQKKKSILTLPDTQENKDWLRKKLQQLESFNQANS